MGALTTPHERALTLLFTELESAAEEQTEAFLGTPGSLAERTTEAGVRFWVHRYSDATVRRREIYLGKVNDAAATELVATLRGRIESANAAIAAPRSAWKHIARATEALERHLPAAAESAWDALRDRRTRR